MISIMTRRVLMEKERHAKSLTYTVSCSSWDTMACSTSAPQS